MGTFVRFWRLILETDDVARYETDEISPEPKHLRNGQVKEANYYILSKAL